MKMMTCIQLGGACNKKFQAETFEEIAELSKQHGMEMFKEQDVKHLEAMSKMSDLMQQLQAMKAWFKTKQDEFDALSQD